MTIEFAFDPGDKVFVMIDNKARELVVFRAEVIIGRSGADFVINKGYGCSKGRYQGQFQESQMYRTREELVKAVLSEL